MGGMLRARLACMRIAMFDCLRVCWTDPGASHEPEERAVGLGEPLLHVRHHPLSGTSHVLAQLDLRVFHEYSRNHPVVYSTQVLVSYLS